MSSSQKLRISSINTADIKHTVIFNLIKNLSKKEVEIVEPRMCDIFFFGNLNFYSVKNVILNRLKEISYLEKIKKFFASRKILPLKVFYSTENVRHNIMDSDFSITSDLGVYDENHLRIQLWKHYIDWRHEGIFRDDDSLNSKRFGSFYSLEDLMKPQGNKFLKKKRNICLFAGHLNEPRRSIYLNLSKYFKIDGFGPYFDKNIKDHNSSNFKKIDIMKEYAFNLCPENSLYPGYYTEKIPDAFLGKCLPISWADQNINQDFNSKSFVNLLDYSKAKYEDICELLKDDVFLKKFSNEPLLINKPDLSKEIIFVEKILKSL